MVRFGRGLKKQAGATTQKRQRPEEEPEELEAGKRAKVRAVERADGTIHIKRGPRIPLGTIREPLRFLPWFSEDKDHPLPKPFEGVDIQFKRNKEGELVEVAIKYAKRKVGHNLRDEDIRYLLQQARENGWSEISAEGFDAKTRKRIYEMAVKEYEFKINPSEEDKTEPFIQKLMQEGLKTFESKQKEKKDFEVTAKNGGEEMESGVPSVNVKGG